MRIWHVPLWILAAVAAVALLCRALEAAPLPPIAIASHQRPLPTLLEITATLQPNQDNVAVCFELRYPAKLPSAHCYWVNGEQTAVADTWELPQDVYEVWAILLRVSDAKGAYKSSETLRSKYKDTSTIHSKHVSEKM